MDSRLKAKARARWALLGLLTAALGAAAESELARLPHHDDAGGYTNPHVDVPDGSFFSFMRTRLFGDDVWAVYDPENDGPIPQMTPSPLPGGGVSTNATVTWVGHSTVLIQHRGVNVLTDPMFSERASPLGFVGPKRWSPPALGVDALPPIDVVVISHNHYDHLDVASIQALGDAPRYFVPLGVRQWFIELGIDPERVRELDWWGDEVLDFGGERLQVTATPSQHFSGRSLADRNETLWAAWAIRWDDFSLWFGGDTGYNDVQFKEIGRRFGGFDLGVIPIGAYLPRAVMETVHVDPFEAVAIHHDIGARRSLAVHWGTFELSAEPLLEPARALRRATAEAGLEPAAFTTFAVGETRAYLPQADAPSDGVVAPVLGKR